MLQAMRNGMNSWFTRIIISSLFIFALAGLVLSDTSGFFREGVSKGSVAEIGKQELSFQEFDRAYRLSLSNLEIPQLASLPQYREIIARDTLKREIRTRILGYTARENGLVINDDIAAKKLREYLKPLTDGNMMEGGALQYVLQRQGITENMLVNNVKNEFAVQLMMTALTAPVRAPWQLVSDLEKYKNESRSAYYIKIKNKDFAVEEPNEEALKSFYKSKTLMWKTPEYRAISVLKLTPELVLEKTFGESAVTKEEIKSTYDDRILEFSEEDRRIVSQASFANEKDAKAMKKFMDKNKSMSLEQALEKNKDLNGFYISAEEYTRNEILPQELTEPVFDYKKETGVIEPVKSPLGWHLAVIESTIRGKVQSFDEVKDALRQEIVADKVSDPMFEMVNELEDMFAGGDSVKEATDFLKLPIENIPAVDKSGRDINGKKLTMDKLSKTALRYSFTIKSEDDPSTEMHAEMQELEDGSFVAFSVNKITYPKKIDFEEVKKDVLTVWIKEQQEKQVKTRVKDIISAVRSGKSSLKDHALGRTKLSYMPLTKRYTGFNGDGKTSVPNDFIFSVFEIKQEKDISSIPVGDGTIVVQLDEIEIGEAPKQMSELSPEQKVRIQREKHKLENGMREDIIEQFLRARINKYGVKINEYSFSKQYGAKAQAQAENPQ